MAAESTVRARLLQENGLCTQCKALRGPGSTAWHCVKCACVARNRARVYHARTQGKKLDDGFIARTGFHAIRICDGCAMPDDEQSVFLGFADGEWNTGYLSAGRWVGADAMPFPEDDQPLCWADMPEVPFCAAPKAGHKNFNE